MTSVFIALEAPFVRIGVEATLNDTAEFEVVGHTDDVAAIGAELDRLEPDVLILDEQFRRQDVELLPGLAKERPDCRALVMVDHTDEQCTLRSLLTGPRDSWPDDSVLKQVQECCILALRQSARGCLPKASTPDRLVSALRAVVAGEVWAGPGLATFFRDAIADAGDARSPSRLTAREIEVVGLVVDSLSNREIGERLNLSEQTVKNHVARIMDKLDVRNRVELALYAVRERLA
jgi:DNA-binding NarL/FixJ family response regulator